MSNIIVSPSGGLIEFNTGVAGGDTFFPSTAPIRLDATGGNTWFTGTNVGIGTTSPDTNLQIRDYTLDSKDILHLRSSGDNVGDYVGMKFTTAAGGAGPHAAIRTYVGPYGNDSYISLLTTTDGGTLTQGLTQTHNGNVGVGVTNPAYALQVEGATYTSSTSYAITQFQLVGGKYWSFKAANSSNDLHFYAAGDGATRMALTSGGNLGIGTADPEATLQVGTHSNTMPSDTALFLGVNDLRFSTTNDNADYGSYLKPSYDAGPTPDVSILTLGTRFTTTDTDVLTLYGSDVGIGTTSPLSTLDVRGTISGSGDFLGTGVGNRITSNGTPYLLSGDAASALTLQNVCDNGNTTTTSMSVEGQYLSGVSGVFSHQVQVTGGDLWVSDTSKKLQVGWTYYKHGAIEGNGNDIRIAPGGTRSLILHGGDELGIQILDGGNVGIGTNNPAYPLHVYGVGRPAVFESSNGSNITKFGNSTCGVATYNGLDINVNSTNSCGLQTYGMPMTFWTSTGNGVQGAERLRIEKDGKVGIGTTNPTGLLTVTGVGANNTTNYGIISDLNLGSNSTNIAGYFSSTNASTNYALKTVGLHLFGGNVNIREGYIDQRSDHSSTVGNIFVGDTTSSYSAGNGGDIVFAGDSVGQGIANSTFANIRGIKENSTYNNSLGALVFGTQDDAAESQQLDSVSEKMRITSDGYVGIGTGDPNNMLEVYKAADPKIILSDANSFKIALTTDGTNGTIESLNAAYATHVTPISFDLNTAVVTTKELHVTSSTSTTTLQMGNNSHRILSAPDDFAIVQTTSANKAFRLLGNVPADTLVLKSNGNVGIGTDAPSELLHVSGGILLAEKYDAAETWYNIIASDSTNSGVGTLAGIGFQAQGWANDTVKAGIFQKREGSYGRGSLYFVNNNDGSWTSSTEADAAITIDPDRNVGIGSASPTVVLDVVANEVALTAATASQINWYVTPGTSKHFNFYNIRQNSDFQFKQNVGGDYTDTFVIKGDDGSVGIGTNAPDAKLHISGSDASSSTNSLLVENSAGVDMLWVDNGKNVHTRDNFYVHHETVSTRKLRLGWGLVAAHDANNELTLASVYTDGDANKIFICGPTADNYPSDTIQVQANNGLSIYSGASPFPPEYHLHVSGDVGGTGIGDRITLNGTGYLLSGDAASALTLQNVCDNDNSTTTSILSTGPHISGVTGLFSHAVGIGTDSPAASLQINSITTPGISFAATTAKIGELTDLDTAKIYSNGAYLKYFAGSSYHAFWNNSAETMRITTDGYVGIGVTDPDERLEVAGNIKFSSDGNQLRAADGNTLLNELSNVLTLGNAGTTITNIHGDVGIGITNPEDGACHIYKNATIGTIVAPNKGNAALHIEDQHYDMYIDGNSILGTNATWISTSGSYSLSFGTNNTERVTIEAGGNVGIGTTNPTEPLTIRNSSENVNFVGLNIGNDMHVTNTKDAWIKFESSTPSNDQSWAIGCSNDRFRIVDLGARATDPHNGTEVMGLIGGKVGIGTTAPSNKLTIATDSPICEIRDGGFLMMRPSGNANDFRLTALDTVGGDVVWGGATTTSIMRWANNGNVSIGTTTPLAKLDVRGTISGSGDFLGTGVGNRITNNGTPYLLSGDSPAETQTLQQVCDNGSTTTTDITISDVGSLFVAHRVGIGTVSPTTKVHITGDTPILQLTESAGDNEVGISLNHSKGGEHYNWFVGTLDGDSRTLTIGATVTNGWSTDTAQAAASLFAIDQRNGNVGIGTVSPNALLEINDNIPRFSLYDTATSKRWEINKQYGGLNFAEIGAADMRLFLKDGGDVGIGVDPSYALDVSSSTTDQVARFKSTDADAFISIEDNYDSVYIGHSSGDNVMSLGFSSTMGSTSNLSIDTAGHVGIGTNVPDSSVPLTILGPSAGRFMTLDAPTDGAYMTFETAGTAYADIGSEKGITAAGAVDDLLINVRGARELIFKTNSTERLRIDSAGFVGVGTGNPLATLDVDGDMRIRNSYDPTYWVQWMGFHVDSRMRLRDSEDNDVIQVRPTSNIQAFGEGQGASAAGCTDWAFLSTRDHATAAGLTIGSSNGTSDTHKSLGISTPQCAGIYGSSGPPDDYIELNTYSVAANTWAGERPAMRFGASGFDFHADTGSSPDFPDDPHFSINHAGYSYFTGKLGIGTTAPSYNLDFGTGAASTIRLVGEANGTAIRVGAGAAGGCDLTLLRVDGSSTQYSGVSDSGNYGFSLKYMGSRSSYDNGLSIFADNAEAAPIEALTIIQNGKVGIGSTSPAYTLDVVGNASISSNLTTPFVYAVNGFGSNGNNLIYFNSASNYAKINTNGVERMRITSAGDVGIGTDTPTTPLHVKYAAAQDSFEVGIKVENTVGDSKLRIEGTNDDTAPTWGRAGAGIDLRNLDTTAGNYSNIQFYNGAGYSFAGIVGTCTVTGASDYTEGKLGFYTRNATDNYRLSMTVDESGMVGIGTSSPTEMLHLRGGVATALVESTTNQANLRLTNTSNSFDLRVGNSDFSILDGSDERMRISSAGYVGIGTTSPANRLDVRGSTLLSGTISVGSSTNAITWPNTAGQSNSRTWGWTAERGAYGTFHLYSSDASDGTLDTDVLRFNNAGDMMLLDGNVGIGTTAPLATLDVRGDISGSGSFLGTGVGNRITNNGTPYLLSGDSPAETQTLQQVTDRGSTTTNAITSSGPHISGVTGLFSDKVGIGTSAPAALLQIDTPAAVQFGQGLRLNRPSAGTHYHSVEFSTNGTVDWSVGQNADDSFQVYEDGSASSTRFTIKEGGNVGIGTTAPSTTLQVGDGTVDDILRVKNSDNTYVDIHGYGIEFNRTYSYLRPTSDKDKLLRIGADGQTWDTVQVDTEKFEISKDDITHFYITDAGKVGIGTDSPSAALHVLVDDAQDAAGAALTVENSTGDSKLEVVGANDNTDGAYSANRAGGSLVLQNMDVGNGNYTMVGFRNAGGSSIGGIHCHATIQGGTDVGEGKLDFYTRNATDNYRLSMTLDESGRLGIGTDARLNPTEILTVDGNIKIADTDKSIIGYSATESIRFYNPTNEIILSAATAIRFGTALRIAGNNAVENNDGDNYWQFYDQAYDGFAQSLRFNVPIVVETSEQPILTSRTNLEFRIDSNDDSTSSKFFVTRDTGEATVDELFTIVEDGNVGIGTNAPDHIFHVQSAGNPYATVESTDAGAAQLKLKNTAGAFGWRCVSDTLNAYDYNDGRQIMTLDGAGFVGIGTVSPVEMLHIKAAGATNLKLESSSTSDTRLIFKNSARQWFTYQNSVGTYIIADNTAGAERISIPTNGNVGIGTTPEYKLHVNSTTTDEVARFQSTDRDAFISIEDNVTTGYVGVDGAYPTLSLGFNTDMASTSNLSINTDGYVGIGTRTPTSQIHIQSQTGSITIGGNNTKNARLDTTFGQWDSVGDHVGTYHGQTSILSTNGSPSLRGFWVGHGGSYAENGVTWSGPSLIGFYSEQHINTASHRGTIANQYGFRASAGINSCGVGGTVTNAYGVYIELANNDSDGTVTNSYGVYIDDTDTAGASTNRWGIYSEGSATKNYFQGSVGIGTNSNHASSKLDVIGAIKAQEIGNRGGNFWIGGDSNGTNGNGLTINYFDGSDWNEALEVNNTAGGAEGDLLLMQGGGSVGIGTATPNAAYKLHVHGLAYATGAVIGNSYAGQSPPTNGLVVEGNVGIGYYASTNKLGVYGNASVGSSYQSIAAPSNGLIVEGNVGIGNNAPQAELDVSGAIKGGFSLSAKSADFTLGVGDNGGFINGTSASFDQITISSDLGADFNVAVMNTGANVVITGSSSMIINGTVDGGVTLASGYQPASIVRLATNTYAVFGNLS